MGPIWDNFWRTMKPILRLFIFAPIFICCSPPIPLSATHEAKKPLSRFSDTFGRKKWQKSAESLWKTSKDHDPPPLMAATMDDKWRVRCQNPLEKLCTMITDDSPPTCVAIFFGGYKVPLEERRFSLIFGHGHQMSCTNMVYDLKS